MDVEQQKKAAEIRAACQRGEISDQAAATQIVEMLGYPQPRMTPEERARADDLHRRLAAAGVYDGWDRAHQSNTPS